MQEAITSKSLQLALGLYPAHSNLQPSMTWAIRGESVGTSLIQDIAGQMWASCMHPFSRQAQNEVSKVAEW